MVDSPINITKASRSGINSLTIYNEIPDWNNKIRSKYDKQSAIVQNK
jgi:hypothetical protein